MTNYNDIPTIAELRNTIEKCLDAAENIHTARNPKVILTIGDYASKIEFPLQKGFYVQLIHSVYVEAREKLIHDHGASDVPPLVVTTVDPGRDIDGDTTETTIDFLTGATISVEKVKKGEKK